MVDTIRGTNEDDTLVGSTVTELIQSYSGDDSIVGGGGPDTIEGGDGNDTIWGGMDDDSIGGGQGDNFIYGGNDPRVDRLVDDGDDVIRGGDGKDVVYAGGGNNSVSVYGGDNTVYAGDGNDFLRTDSGAEDGVTYMFIGKGDDTVRTGQYADSIGIYGAGADQYVNSGNKLMNLFEGDDSVKLGDGDDTVDGADGNDSIWAGAGNDYFNGGNGEDGVQGEAGDDFVRGGWGNDTVHGGEGNDTVIGSFGNDYVIGWKGNDFVDGGDGNDTVLGYTGNDLFYGGRGDDYLSEGDVNAAGEDTFYGGDGNDTLVGRIQNDLLFGGAGDDRFEEAQGDGDDTFFGDAVNLEDHESGAKEFVGDDDTVIDVLGGNDLVHAHGGDDSILLAYTEEQLEADENLNNDNSGDNTVYGQGGNDHILVGNGNDVIYGGTEDNMATLNGGMDTYVGGQDADVVYAGDDNDLVHITTDDTVYGGNDEETFMIMGENLMIYERDPDTGEFVLDDDGNKIPLTDQTSEIYIDGGTGETTERDYDTLDFEDVRKGNEVFSIVPGSMNKTLDEDGDSWSGSFQITDGSNTWNVTFVEIENIPCFARGTQIETEAGLVAVEDLKACDMVRTKDHGFKTLEWIGSSLVSGAVLARKDNLRPICIAADALAPGYPAQDLIVSPQHRILVNSKLVMRMFGELEVLVPAKQLLMLDGVDYVDADEVEYFHLMFDQHEIVFANGMEAESLYTGPEALKSVSADARAEMAFLFPELLEVDAEFAPMPVRTIVSGSKARKMAIRHKWNNMPLVS